MGKMKSEIKNAQRVIRSASRSGNEAMADAGREFVAGARKSGNSTSRNPGVKQRDVDSAVRGYGGRGSKAIQAVKDLQGATTTQSPRLQAKTVGRLRALAVAPFKGGAAAGMKFGNLLRAGSRGMLSPAGLEETVVGRVVQGVQKDKFMQEAREEISPRGKGRRSPVRTKT